MPGPRAATVEEAAALVRSGDRIVLGTFSSEPAGLVRALCDRASELHDVTITAGILLDGYPFLAFPKETFRFRTWFAPTALTRHEVDGRRIEYLPISWAQIRGSLERDPIDFTMIQVSPPGPDGRHSMGTSAGYNTLAVERARTVIAVVNHQMPYTFGDTELAPDAVDVLVEVDEPLAEYPTRTPDGVERVIADRVAETVPDGAVLQVGVGSLPAAVISAVAAHGRRGLQQFSVLTDSFLELVAADACAGSGPMAIVGEVVGSRALYEHVHRNRAIEMADSRVTHHLDALLGRRRMVTLNSALEVDLFGQANSEILGGRQVGGVGGSVDFLTASASASDAGSTVMLRSETGSGRSRIVARLEPGPVSIGRTLMRRVVTEHGTAELDGLSVRERATALAELAAPAHRDELRRHVRDHPDLFCG